MVAKGAAIYNPHIETGCDCNPHIEMGCDWTRCAGRPGGTTGNELLAAFQLTVQNTDIAQDQQALGWDHQHPFTLGATGTG